MDEASGSMSVNVSADNQPGMVDDQKTMFLIKQSAVPYPETPNCSVYSERTIRP
jgi:hypothetical protein